MIPKSTKVRKQLVERLRDCIIDSTFKPGERLVERELCESFSVSRPSVREALRQLEAECLIDIIPHSGPMVCVLDLEEVIALWDLRLAIGGLAARRFAEKGTPAEIEAFAVSIKTHEEALSAKDAPLIRTSKSELFETFAAGAHNTPLSRAFSQINAQLSFSWAASLRLPGRPQEAIAELLTLLASIRQRNADAAQAAYLLYSEHAKASGLLGFKTFQRENSTRVAGKNIKETNDDHEFETPGADLDSEDLCEGVQS